MNTSEQRQHIESIASVCHEANRRWCQVNGDDSQPGWLDAPQWQRDSAVAGILAIAEGRVTSPEDSHRNWSAVKEAEGWCWGPVKDPERKQHPCLVPYHELPAEQKAKDALFLGVAMALLFGRYPVAPAAELVPDPEALVTIPIARIVRLHELADSLQHRDHGLASQIRSIIDPKPPLDPPAPFNAPSTPS